MPTAQLQLYHTSQGKQMAGALGDAFAGDPAVSVESNRPPPDGDTPAAGLFLLTPDAGSDPALATAATAAAKAGLPLLPVVPNLAAYDFSALPGPLAILGTIDAAEWGADGAEAIQAARRLLGLELFRQEARLFISYRRSDGEEAARSIHHHLTHRGFNAFLDTRDMQAGQRVQRRIHQEIAERDLLLLINSPQAVNSPWVLEEVEQALARQVTVVVADLHHRRFPMLRDLPGVAWQEGDADRLSKVEKAIVDAVAQRRRFDERVRGVVQRWCELRGWEPLDITPRRLRLVAPDLSACLLEYEQAPHSLDRLYRLYEGHRGHGTTGALFVHGGLPLSEKERKAVEWAIHAEPLHVVALEELVALLESTCTGGAGGAP